MSERHRVRDYKVVRPKENRYYFKSNLQFLESGHNWGYFRSLFNSEYNQILNNQLSLTSDKSKQNPTRDVLFEYLVIRGVTILEIGLKMCCRNYVKMFPERSKKLIDFVDPDIKMG